MQQPIQESDIVEDSEEKQTLGARKESLICKRKQLNVTKQKFTCVEKRVRSDLPHDQRIVSILRRQRNKIKFGILKHRMACNNLFFLIKRLDYPQWIAAMETGFGGILSVRTSTIPKNLATWLIENFDPASNTLKFSDNRMLEITKEDVYATLALLMGLLEVEVASMCKLESEYTKLLKQWRTRWNHGRTSTMKVGKIVEQILEREDHGEEFKRDFDYI